MRKNTGSKADIEISAEEQYGKDSNKLLDYGIKPRVTHPRKGPRTKNV